jgi:TonB family protein
MNAAVAQELWQGQTIDGKFALLESLGGSGHSAVFRTQLPDSSNQTATIKLIRADREDAAQQIACWRRLVTLSHPNLLRVFHAGYCQMAGAPWLYVVMEYAEENLEQVLPVRPLSTAEVEELLPPTIDALAYLHAQGLVHAGIKPSNICAINNQVKLSIDSVHPVSQILKPYSLSAYDAPESESGTLSTAADIWSLGMTLVAGFDQRPLTWSRSNTLDPGVPKSVPLPYGLIARECLRMNPSERCSLGRVKELLHQQPLLPKPVPPKKPKNKIVAPLVAALALGAVIVGIRLRHTTESQSAPVAPVATTEQQPTPNTEVQKPTAYSSRSGAVAKSSAKSSVKREPATERVSRQVVTQPSAEGVAKQVLPQVPRSARQTIHGKVKVKVRVAVDPNGDVSSATLVSPGPSQYFARLALEASRQWKFKPAGVDRQSAQWLLEYRFGRSSTEVTPVESR